MSEYYWPFTPSGYHLLDCLSKSYFFEQFRISRDNSVHTLCVALPLLLVRCAKPRTCFLLFCSCLHLFALFSLVRSQIKLPLAAPFLHLALPSFVFMAGAQLQAGFGVWLAVASEKQN
jgi:hypothetical protein